MYGTRKAISDFSVTLFDNSNYSIETIAEDYCSNINALELKDDNWIHAIIVKENQKIEFIKPRYIDFDMLNTLDNRAIQKVIRKVNNHYVFAKALKSAKNETVIAVLRNISKRAARMLVDNMEYMGPIRFIDVIEARSQVVEIIRGLEKTGEIVVPKSGQVEKN
jgi:flagellar motor switch protein FliG